MNRLLLCLFFLLLLQNLIAQEFSFSGTNELEYIYRDITEDNTDYDESEKNYLLFEGYKFKHYFIEKLDMQFYYGNFNAGFGYDFYRPDFNKFALAPSTEEDENYFDEYYLKYESDNLNITAGIYEAVIGKGIALHSYYNEDFEEDSRLLGGYTNVLMEKWQSKIFFGLMENADNEDEDDKIGAFDSSLDITKDITAGLSYVWHNQWMSDDEYNRRDIFAARANFFYEDFEISNEFAHILNQNFDDGTALYSTASLFLDKFTFVTSYKNYTNMDSKISDLPVANHTDDQLAEGWTIGKDEEGLMGEISYYPNFDNEFLVNYAEGWSDDYLVRQSDFYAEYKHYFSEWSIKSEISILEQLNKNTKNFHKDLKPVLTADFAVKDFPIIIKGEYQYKKDTKGQIESDHFEPKLQTDISYKDYSLSFIGETQIGDSDDAEDGDTWLGIELAAYLFNNTDVRLFFGKEKGGKICRNGVCKYQSEFEGIKLDIINTF